MCVLVTRTTGLPRAHKGHGLCLHPLQQPQKCAPHGARVPVTHTEPQPREAGVKTPVLEKRTQRQEERGPGPSSSPALKVCSFRRLLLGSPSTPGNELQAQNWGSPFRTSLKPTISILTLRRGGFSGFPMLSTMK